MNVPLKLHDYHPATDILMEEVVAGLGADPKRLPAKLFYDKRGSQLFDQICELPEYYPTRTERSIMRKNAAEIAGIIGSRCVLIEFGSGSSDKTRVLLDELVDPAGYVPIDISKDHLLASAQELARTYPHIEIHPVCADYEQDFDIPAFPEPVSRVVYFPGSTIGNFHPDHAVSFLKKTARLGGPGSHLLIGVDMKKDPAILHAAYNDKQGVTAAFNLNMLHRLNRELGTDFDVEQFQHVAFYNESVGRIEMHLKSASSQQVTVDGNLVTFQPGETIWTESSYKYTIEDFTAAAAHAGYARESIWTDDQGWFSVMYFSIQRSGQEVE